MAEAAYVSKVIGGDHRTVRLTWNLSETDDEGQPIAHGYAPERTVQVTGDLGGGTVRLQGSLEETPTTWADLTDPQGNAIAISSPKIETVMENVFWVRPVLEGATGGAAVVTLYLRHN